MEEKNILLYGAREKDGERISKKVEGIENYLNRILLRVRYMGSSLTGMTYIFDEPSTGMHPRDVHRMSELLKTLRDKGNTVIVIEHNLDVMKQADYIIDIGPDGGSGGGEVVFTGTPKKMIDCADTITSRYLRESIINALK